MKVRNGFVSNSSSSSFLVLSKNMPEIPKSKDKYKDCVHVEVIEEEYGRSRNEVVKTLEDKLRLVTSFYAMNFNDWRNFDEDTYINKMIEFKKKIKELGKKYKIAIYITAPPIFFSHDIDFDENGNPIELSKVNKEVKVGTEWYDGIEIIKDIVEDKDTSRLERLLFNPQSFFIVGGDEYYENEVLQYNERQKVEEQNYEYEVFGDENEETWGLWEPYYIHGGVPKYDDYIIEYSEGWYDSYEQPNLPFSYDLEDK